MYLRQIKRKRDYFMKFVIQRVKEASVTVDGNITGAIRQGFLIFVGVCNEDTEEIADKMLKKALNLRIFPDSDGKTNCSLQDTGGELLWVSQFTLYANCKKGNRPSFFDAGSPDHANALYEYLIRQSKEYCDVVQTGIFGANMKVSLTNDGPFTIVLDSNELFA